MKHKSYVNMPNKTPQIKFNNLLKINSLQTFSTQIFPYASSFV